MSVTALSPGPLFPTSGMNRKFTPVKLDATPRQIKETFKRLLKGSSNYELLDVDKVESYF